MGKKKVVRHRRYRKKVRHSKASPFKSVAVCATIAGGIVHISGVGADVTSMLVGGMSQFPLIGKYLGTGAGVLTALWVLKLSGSRKWAAFVRSTLGGRWRP